MPGDPDGHSGVEKGYRQDQGPFVETTKTWTAKRCKLNTLEVKRKYDSLGFELETVPAKRDRPVDAKLETESGEVPQALKHLFG